MIATRPSSAPMCLLRSAVSGAGYAVAADAESAESPPVYADAGMPFSGTVTILFTDLVGSTELGAQLGDDAADQLRRSHFGALREAVAAHRGEEVKNLGDGLMVAF